MQNKMFYWVLMAVVFICPACNLPAQSPGEISYEDISILPEGPKGEKIEACIAAVNSNSAEKVLQFLKAYCTPSFIEMAPLEEHAQVFTSFYQETGGITFHSVRKYVPELEETVVIAQENNFGGWRGISFRFDEQDQIAGLGFSPARTPTNVQEDKLTEASMLEKIREGMDKLCQKDAFSGTLLIAKGEKVLLEYVCGEASKRFHVPNNMDTKFNLGSMNKMFTSTAILQLVEKGKLNLDDKISRYIDESWLPKKITDQITVHHLLSHTSGLGSYFNETYWKTSREQFRQLEDYKPLIKDEEPAFEPGKRFQYSNTGMFLLGVIIEQVSGENYFDYIRANIAEPAGMKNTDCYEMDLPVENLAIGYVPNKSSYGWENNIYKHVLKGGPAGGGFSTVGDLHRFAMALQGEKLVSKGSLEKMWQQQSKNSNYGYGFSVEDHPTGKVVGHSGGFPGLNSNLDICLDSGYIVAVMSNYDRAASPVARQVLTYINRL